ncbi:MAG TPA: nitroreductase/quinone reductase family protein [Acidimicrobiia bacterium]|nr:nitroreductase/quinone reductase family protein [Acidimicrobiia bacterium]
MTSQRPSDETLAAHRTIEITTVGRRTGQPRRMEIWWFYVEGRFFITGTPGARDWYANVNRSPELIVHVAGWDLPAMAHPIKDLETRSMIFDSELTRWYSDNAQRQRLIDDAPMIEVVF